MAGAAAIELVVVPVKRISLNRLPPSADAASSRGKPFVMAHNQLRLNLIDGIHRHAYDDQQRCAAEIEVHVQSVQQKAREMRIDKLTQRRWRQVLQLNARRS